MTLVLGLTLITRGSNPHKVLALLALSYAILGFTDFASVFAVAANPSVVAVILLLIISPTLIEGVGLRRISHLFNSAPSATLDHTSISTSFAKLWEGSRLLTTTALLSAVISNTALVSSLIAFYAKDEKLAHRWLLAISYTSILGGTLTLVGTSTNLIINAMLIELGHEPMHFLTTFPIAACVLLFCIPLIMGLSRRFVHKNDAQKTWYDELWHVEVSVPSSSPLVGQTITQAQLRNLGTHFISAVERGQHTILAPSGDFILAADDRLKFQGDLQGLQQVLQHKGIALGNPSKQHYSGELVLCVVPKSSPLVGVTLKDADFRTKVDAVVVGIQRSEERKFERLGHSRIVAGDMLALVCGPNFKERAASVGWFRLLDTGMQSKSVLWPVIAFVGILCGYPLGLFELHAGLIVLLACMLLGKVIDLETVQKRLPLALWSTLACSLVIADTVQVSGLSTAIADGLYAINEYGSPGWTYICVYMAALLLTTFITNVAAVTIIVPATLQIATTLDISSWPLIMACLFGCNCSFLMPQSYQTNLMVMSVGQYKVRHYLQLGAPLTIGYSAVCLALIPVFYPL